MHTDRQRLLLLRTAAGALVVLCGVLALLQYRWIGEISRASQERLRTALEASLYRLSADFNREISAACGELMPPSSEIEAMGRERAYASRFAQWRAAARHDGLFGAVALAIPGPDATLALHRLDVNTGAFAAAEWPAAWQPARDRLLARLRRAPAAPGEDAPGLIELPRFMRPESGQRLRGPDGGRSHRPGGPPSPPPFFGEQEWLLLELNLDYVRESFLPELMARHLGDGRSEYQAEMVVRARPAVRLFESNLNAGQPIGGRGDASVSLFEIQFDSIFRRGRGRGGDGPPPQPRNLADSGRGRWLLSVRHRSGSLEALVERARWKNLGVSGAILALMVAAGAALVRSSRQAHRLAELQMNFVTGVSHELRTPLTVIRTAAYNLKGKMGANPEQVGRYGALIQQESEKLTAIVEQVLRFAGAKAGKIVGEREPVSMAAVVDNALHANRGMLEASGCVIERQIDPRLPLVIGDAMALQNAIQNLITNAVKYGTEGGNWIGVFVSAVNDAAGPAVAIRIADRGPGIPPHEQSRIFDAFFRGKRAIQDQVHGTGLGLNLVKQIIAAHGGTVSVNSELTRGTEFAIRIPVAAAGHRDEFAHSAGRG